MSYLKRFTRILRGSLSASPSSATSTGSAGSFHLPLRKMVVRYSQHNPSSLGTRQFLVSPRFSVLTQTYPSVEFVVDQAGREKHPLVVGFYASNGREERSKQVNLANLDANQVEQKLNLVVQSSGNKLNSLKKKSVISRNEGARGIWSQLHDKPVDV